MDTKLNKEVFQKEKFKNTVNTEFTQLVNNEDPGFFNPNLASLDDFWTLYERFFFEIPKQGDINSHEYLIQSSTDYINYTPNREEIEALLEEINNLRDENLELRRQQVDLISSLNNPKLSDQPIISGITQG